MKVLLYLHPKFLIQQIPMSVWLLLFLVGEIITWKIGDHSFDTYLKFSLTPDITPDTHTYVVRNVSFSENFVYVLNGWSLENINIIQFFLRCNIRELI